MAPPRKQSAPELTPTEKPSESVAYMEFPGLVVNAPDPVQEAARARQPRAVDPRTAERAWRIAQESRFGHQNQLQSRFTVRGSNLPIETPEAIKLRADNEAAFAAKSAAIQANRGVASQKWVKLGLQPTAQGYVLHVENFEGDKKVKETVWRKLSPLAARERLALHMSALFAGF